MLRSTSAISPCPDNWPRSRPNEVGIDPHLALRLALSAVDKSPTTDADAALRQATLAFRQVTSLRADSTAAETAAFSPDGSHVVTGGDDGIVRVWDAAAGREIARLAARHGKVLAARYAPDSQRLALGFADGTLLLTNGSLGRAARGAARALVRASTRWRSVATVGGSPRLCTMGQSAFWGRMGMVRFRSSADTSDPSLGVDINSDGSRIVSAGQDGTIRLWDPSTGQSHTLYSGSERTRTVSASVLTGA